MLGLNKLTMFFFFLFWKFKYATICGDSHCARRCAVVSEATDVHDIQEAVGAPVIHKVLSLQAEYFVCSRILLHYPAFAYICGGC